MSYEPTEYHGWYQTPRGQWIAQRELRVLMRLLNPEPGTSLLDVGSGTGQFSRYFAKHGLHVTGVEPDPAMRDFAQQLDGGLDYVGAQAEKLPFSDNSYDYVSAVTSLCFVRQPATALAQMWRVSRRSMVIGLLNRHSLLHRQKAGQGGYTGARWDTLVETNPWIEALIPKPVKVNWRSAVFFPGGSRLARGAERLLSGRLPWGGFLALYLEKPTMTT